MPPEQAGIPAHWMMLLIFLIFYLLVFRPQRKEQKEKQKMRETLKKNEQAVTIGGIHGTIVSVKEKTVLLRVDDNVKVEFDKEAIVTIIKPKKES